MKLGLMLNLYKAGRKLLAVSLLFLEKEFSLVPEAEDSSVFSAANKSVEAATTWCDR